MSIKEGLFGPGMLKGSVSFLFSRVFSRTSFIVVVSFLSCISCLIWRFPYYVPFLVFISRVLSIFYVRYCTQFYFFNWATKENWSSLLAGVSRLIEDVTTDTALMRVSATRWGGTGCELCHLLPYIVEKFICYHDPMNGARRVLKFPPGGTPSMHAVYRERETVFHDWFERRKHGGGRRNSGTETDAWIMNMYFVFSCEEVDYNDRFASLVT